MFVLRISVLHHAHQPPYLAQQHLHAITIQLGTDTTTYMNQKQRTQAFLAEVQVKKTTNYIYFYKITLNVTTKN